ncbi:hypothetical protein OBA41_02525 [Pelagibacteraceae bacterium]|nr:hypothetical protein [Pelagibacteraceae bacterium]
MIIFSVDILKNNIDTRFIIRDITSFDKVFNDKKYKLNIYTNINNLAELKDNIFEEKKIEILTIMLIYLLL